MNKLYILLIVFLFIFFIVTKNNNSFDLNKKSNLRKLLDWEEEVKFNTDRDYTYDEEEEDSIDHCKTSYYTDYKYNIFYEDGKNDTFDENNLVEKNDYYADPLFKKIKEVNNKGTSDNWGAYLNHIGLFFFFVGCACISIIVWIFNWICWLNQCCCCDFLHNPINKRIAWWTSFTFLLGVLACCISGFVTVNRFGFALEGSRCAFDRIYYDAFYGQLKYSIPRWEGLYHIYKFIENIENPECKDNEGKNLKELIPQDSVFKAIKNNNIFMKYFHDKEDILKGFLNILAMIYFCLFLIAATSAGVSMMFYACLKRQGYLITLMHVLWNIIRFFIFSFFLYGTAYGIFFLILSDLIGVMKMIFLSTDNNNAIIFLKGCLSPPDPKITQDSPVTVKTLFLEHKQKIISCFKNVECSNIPNINEKQKNVCNNLKSNAINGLGPLYFDCSFLKGDLNHLYKALNDASLESQKLAGISLCAAFFGAVAIYFYILVMHHYNNELFFDSGKSIFTGFDGFGRGYKNKNKNNDPAYKKRKLRAEIELTSKNDEQNEFKDINKNDDD